MGEATGIRGVAWRGRAVGLILIAAVPFAATASIDPPELCHRAALTASRATGVPIEVLTAIALTETGRSAAGRLQPWPWTLNIAGKGHWLPGRDAALALARQTRAGGQTSFDLGCFQVNYRWHGQAFSSLEAMLDPVTNATYAAEFLADLYRELGDWSRAAGAYHSRTPEHASKYRRIFDRHFARAGGAPPGLQLAALPRERAAPRENRFPLLQAGRSTAPGSIVPTGGGGIPFLQAGPARPIWGG